MARYWDDQLALQQQEADRLRRTINKDLQTYRNENQVRTAVCSASALRYNDMPAHLQSNLQGWDASSRATKYHGGMC